MKEYIIYTKDNCHYCDKAKNLLNLKGAAFTDINITKKPEALKEMLEKSKGKKTFPQIFKEGLHIGGCDDLHAHFGIK